MTDSRTPAELARVVEAGLGNSYVTMAEAVDALAELQAQAEDARRWLAWSGGEYPDDSPGDVIAAEPDGTIVLDDAITTWNPLRALAFLAAASPSPADTREET